ncbi:MAG TPA: DNA gyrase inhibitor YacG [Rhodospirillales bacterium]|jgi:hypothetical protein|nr:DNA gyrase inhibitor YacG [Rhodospirillales bacterium]HJO69109.1 DNA gyrase inhibitor YacG [Rhodospirillales bacterium]
MSEDDRTNPKDEAARPGPRRCAVCGRPEIARTRPFCSRRCADVDLGRWLKGLYQIPASRTNDEDE